MTGWSTDASLPCPGGEYWAQPNSPVYHVRAADTTGPASEISTHLYELTKDHKEQYLAFSIQSFAWLHECLIGQTPYGPFVYNAMDLNGTIDTAAWSYCQGVYIGAAALLYRSTRNSTYLTLAQQVLQSSLNYFGNGTEGDNWYKMPADFNAIWFKNALILASVLQREGIHDPNIDIAWTTMKRYVDTLWVTCRNETTGLFMCLGRPRLHLYEQAAVIQIMTLLAWNPKDYILLA